MMKPVTIIRDRSEAAGAHLIESDGEESAEHRTPGTRQTIYREIINITVSTLSFLYVTPRGDGKQQDKSERGRGGGLFSVPLGRGKHYY